MVARKVETKEKRQLTPSHPRPKQQKKETSLCSKLHRREKKKTGKAEKEQKKNKKQTKKNKKPGGGKKPESVDRDKDRGTDLWAPRETKRVTKVAKKRAFRQRQRIALLKMTTISANALLHSFFKTVHNLLQNCRRDFRPCFCQSFF